MKKLLHYLVLFTVLNTTVYALNTIKCETVKVNDTFVVNGKNYTVVDNASIKNIDKNNGDFEHICTSHVTSMKFLFAGVSAFNQNIGAWDVSRVTDMHAMFKEATSFNQDIGDWDTSSVMKMIGMFSQASSFNQDISTWDTSKVRDASYMFYRAIAFNHNIASWDVSKVRSMTAMFWAAKAFNQNIDTWDVSSVRKMTSMFKRATSFNQTLASWDVSTVTNMGVMFYKATSFNQDIHKWNVANVTEHDRFAKESALIDAYNPFTQNDTQAPTLTLNGQSTITLEQNAVYTELGATAVDAVDGNVSVSISGSVDMGTVGTYTITYTARDSAGNEASIIRNVKIINPVPILSSISLESNVTTLNVGEKAELTVMATYSDGSTVELDANVEYIITPSDSVDINGSVITVKKDGDVTVQAKVNGVLSNTLNLTIAWVVDGHVLPPEPDKTLNDSTLLGIDVNDNGVRDDVERWIYEEYKDKHPIYVDIGMQAARGYKLVLETPERAKEIRKIVNASIHCNWYYKGYAEFFNEPLLIKNDINPSIFSRYFSTAERRNVYWQYDTLLSGGSYPLPKIKTLKSYCDFNTSVYEE